MGFLHMASWCAVAALCAAPVAAKPPVGPASGIVVRNGTLLRNGKPFRAIGINVTAIADDILANGTTLTDMHWVDMGYTFTASGSSTTLTFASTTAGTSYAGPALDNVTVTAIATTGASCKNGGWETNHYLDANNNPITFTNQGQCVSHFATSGAVPIGN